MTAMAQALSPNMENYLETIWMLVREHTVARSKDIASRLNVKRASVTGALRALKDRGLVNYEPYGFVTLTREGTEIARRVRDRHVALRDFMIHVLSIDEADADEAACHMEHGISKHIVDRFVDFADFVESCPRAGSKWIHGFAYRCDEGAKEPQNCERCIEQCLDEVKKRETKGEPAAMSLPLSELNPGRKGRIAKVSGEGAVKRRIRDMGVTTGSLVEVVRVAPMGDPIDVKVKGYHLTLRKEEAADIRVTEIGS